MLASAGSGIRGITELDFFNGGSTKDDAILRGLLDGATHFSRTSLRGIVLHTFDDVTDEFTDASGDAFLVRGAAHEIGDLPCWVVPSERTISRTRARSSSSIGTFLTWSSTDSS